MSARFGIDGMHNTYCGDLGGRFRSFRHAAKLLKDIHPGQAAEFLAKAREATKRRKAAERSAK